MEQPICPFCKHDNTRIAYYSFPQIYGGPKYFCEDCKKAFNVEEFNLASYKIQ